MSHEENDDPRCPECGGPIGATATYCMHCSADLTEARERADTNDDGFWDRSPDHATDAGDGRLLDPEGPLDDALTVLVGVGGGLVVGVIGTFVLLFVTSNALAFPVGVLAWLVATAHLVRQRSVLETIARTAYGVAIVLVLVPLIAFGPSSDASTDLAARVVVFLVMLGGVAIPAAIAAGIGYALSRYAPETASEE